MNKLGTDTHYPFTLMNADYSFYEGKAQIYSGSKNHYDEIPEYQQVVELDARHVATQEPDGLADCEAFKKVQFKLCGRTMVGNEWVYAYRKQL